MADENYIPNTMKIAFKNHGINKKLCTYLRSKQLQENIGNDDHSLANEEQHKEAMTSNMEEIENHLIDDNMVVNKGIEGIAVNVFLK